MNCKNEMRVSLRPIGEGSRVADLRLEAEPETGRRAERIDEGVKQ
jgi:hypothetical protein